jgi:DNA-directed RNA polymerase specialized sigma24 family protein
MEPTPDEGSITRYIPSLKQGDPDAVRRLWERFYGRLALARLRAVPRRTADEEDVVVSVFDSFCASAARGRFPRLADRNDLWRILVTITARKASDLARHEQRQKRGAGRIRDAADLGGSDEPDVLELVAGPDPSPDLAASAAEECRRLLGLLAEDTFRQIALDRMAGYTDDEIAARLGCTRRTVMRKLVIIRNVWNAELGHED